MKLAFLIAAHTQPELLARLARRLRGPGSSIFIHIDQKADIRPFEKALRENDAGDFHLVPRARSGWGTFGQVRASLALLISALEYDREAERFILISGQDYPLMTPARMAAFFEANADTDFFTCHPLPWSEWEGNGGLDRLRRYHFPMGRYSFAYPSENLPGSRVARAAHAACSLFLPQERPLPEEIALYGGSNWWNLTRHSAMAVLEFHLRHKRFRRMFRFTKSADEIYFQTALLNSPSRQPVEGDDLRCVFWDGRRDEHPAILRMEDYAEIAASRKLFARKMDALFSLPLMERIDHELLGEDAR